MNKSQLIAQQSLISGSGLSKQQQVQYLKILQQLTQQKNPIKLQYLQTKQQGHTQSRKQKSQQKNKQVGLLYGLQNTQKEKPRQIEVNDIKTKPNKNVRSQTRSHIMMTDVLANSFAEKEASMNSSQKNNDLDDSHEFARDISHRQNYVTQNNTNTCMDDEDDILGELKNKSLSEEQVFATNFNSKKDIMIVENQINNYIQSPQEFQNEDEKLNFKEINVNETQPRVNEDQDIGSKQDLFSNFMQREDQLPMCVNNVWDRLMPPKRQTVREKKEPTENQDLIEMGCLDQETLTLQFQEQSQPDKQDVRSTKNQSKGNIPKIKTKDQSSKVNNIQLKQKDKKTSLFLESYRSKEESLNPKKMPPKQLKESKFMIDSNIYKKQRIQSAANKNNNQRQNEISTDKNMQKKEMTFEQKKMSSTTANINLDDKSKNNNQKQEEIPEQCLSPKPRILKNQQENTISSLKQSKKERFFKEIEKPSKNLQPRIQSKVQTRPSVFERLNNQNSSKHQKVLTSHSPNIGHKKRNSMNSTPKQSSNFRKTSQNYQMKSELRNLSLKDKQVSQEVNTTPARRLTSQGNAQNLTSTVMKKSTYKIALHNGFSAIQKQNSSQCELKTIDQTGQKRIQDIDKMNQSPQRSLTRQNILNKKHANLLRESLNNADAIKEGIICKIDRVEPYIRRAVHKIGWMVQSEKDESLKFHIKFDVADIDVKLKPHQFYNHFPDNRELTTKAGLCKNLWTNCFQESTLKVSQFFPRCYDLSEDKQIENFTEDFNQTSILSIIKIYALNFLKDQNIRNLVIEYNRKYEFQYPKNYKEAFRKKYFNSDSINKLVSFHQSLKHDNLVGIDTLNILEKIKIVRVHNKLEQMNVQYRCIDGYSNVWVVKPSYSARGLGIFCTNKFKEIIHEGRKNQSKVVQKYVENPLLINNRKFDLRQWVLVTSWEPLDVYIFNTAYLRLCSKEFSLKDLQDVFKHLSNYSVQRKESENPNVMSIDDFEKFLKQEKVWDNTIFPKLQDIIFRTLKAVQETQDVDHKSRCFEVYGFDIMFDQQFNPWVIEVNLSPACSEKRASFLSQMLDDMAFDLVNWLERKILTSPMPEEHTLELNKNLKIKRNQYLRIKEMFETHPFLNTNEFYEQSGIKNRWIRAADSIQEVKEHNLAMNALQNFVNQGQQVELQLLGQKTDIRYEKKLDLNYRKIMSTAIIQRIWRGYKARVRVYNIRLLRAAIIMQKYGRMVLAIKLRKWLKLQRDCTKIQSVIRKILAKKLADKMRAERIQNAKNLIALKLQSQFRRKRDTKKVHQIRLAHNATLLQKYIKGKKAMTNMLKLRYERTMLVRIQKFYKRRYCVFKKKAIVIQKHLKTKPVYYKYRRLRNIKNGLLLLDKLQIHRTNLRGFKSFNTHSKAIKIQCLVRRYHAKRLLTMLQVSQAHKQLYSMIEKISNKAKCRKLAAGLRLVKGIVNSKAIYVQRVLRKYRALGKIQGIKTHLQKLRLVTYLQSLYRMHITRKQYIIMRQNKLEAVIKIQKWMRDMLQKVRYHNAINMVKKHHGEIESQHNQSKRSFDKKKEKRKKSKTAKRRRTSQQSYTYINSQYFSNDESDEHPSNDNEINQRYKQAQMFMQQQCSEEEVYQLEREICGIIESKTVQNEKPSTAIQKSSRNNVHVRSSNKSSQGQSQKPKTSKNTKMQIRNISSQQNLRVMSSHTTAAQTCNNKIVEYRNKKIEDQLKIANQQNMQRSQTKWLQEKPHNLKRKTDSKQKHSHSRRKVHQNDKNMIPLPQIVTKNQHLNQESVSIKGNDMQKELTSYSRMMSQKEETESQMSNNYNKKVNFAEQLKQILFRENSNSQVNYDVPHHYTMQGDINLQQNRIQSSFRDNNNDNAFQEQQRRVSQLSQNGQNVLTQSIASQQSFKQQICKEMLLNRPVKDPRIEALQKMENKGINHEMIRSSSKLLVLKDNLSTPSIRHSKDKFKQKSSFKM